MPTQAPNPELTQNHCVHLVLSQYCVSDPDVAHSLCDRNLQFPLAPVSRHLLSGQHEPGKSLHGDGESKEVKEGPTGWPWASAHRPALPEASVRCHLPQCLGGTPEGLKGSLTL